MGVPALFATVFPLFRIHRLVVSPPVSMAALRRAVSSMCAVRRFQPHRHQSPSRQIVAWIAWTPMTSNSCLVLWCRLRLRPLRSPGSYGQRETLEPVNLRHPLVPHSSPAVHISRMHHRLLHRPPRVLLSFGQKLVIPAMTVDLSSHGSSLPNTAKRSTTRTSNG